MLFCASSWLRLSAVFFLGAKLKESLRVRLGRVCLLGNPQVRVIVWIKQNDDPDYDYENEYY